MLKIFMLVAAISIAVPSLIPPDCAPPPPPMCGDGGGICVQVEDEVCEFICFCP